ncbi:MAG: Hsp70 family protein, partial [Acidimicrobiales bacterium]|nr:Hsp70 family protein [Acidimicrobiales bacterium]
MYGLGIDLGTTYSAAAIATPDGRVEMLPLEHASAIVPSVVAISAGEPPVIGQAAQRRSVTQPQTVAREFKRRFGDTVPYLLDGQPVAPQQLTAHLARWVVDRATAERGEPPASLVFTHPANWGPYKRELLQDVARLIERPDAVFVPEPSAAACWYAHQGRIEEGEVVAVYDFGGGTFDAVVLRRGPMGFEVIGHPTGIDRLGGIDLDDIVMGFALRAAGVELGSLDPSDPSVLVPMARLREEAKQAKEALSSDTSTHLLVDVAGVNLQVRLTRSEFEDIARPAIRDTVMSLRQAVHDAGLTFEDLSSILLVGGSSRVPLVGEIVASETGVPITADAHSKNAVALGAAVLAFEELEHRGRPAEAMAVDLVAAPEPVGAEPQQEPNPEPTVALPDEGPTHISTSTGASPGQGRSRMPLIAVGALVAIAAIVFIAIFALGGGDGDGGSDTTTTTASAVPATTSPDTAPTTAAPADTSSSTVPDDVATVAPGRTDDWVAGVLADPARTNGFAQSGPVAQPAVLWRSSDSVPTGVVVDQGVLYASFQDQTVRAVDLTTGDDIWVRETSFGGRTPTLSQDAVFYVDGFDIVGVDRDTGSQELYRLVLDPDSDTAASPESPTIFQGTLYATYLYLEGDTWTNTVVAVDLDSGETVWTWSQDAQRSLLPVMVTPDAVVLVAEFKVTVLDRLSGSERWTLDLPGDISPNQAMVVDGDLITRDTRMRRYDLQTGDQLWSNPDSDLNMASAAGLVFTHSLDTRALDAGSGDLVWSTGWDGPLISGVIAVGGDTVYSHGGSNGGLAAFDLASGARLWQLVDEEGFQPGLQLVPHDGHLIALDM